MIDINFDKISFVPDLTLEQVEAKIEENWEIKFSTLRETLQTHTQEQHKELAKSFNTLAPYGEYGMLLEQPAQIEGFLFSDASKSENWELQSLEYTDTRLVSEPLLEMVFSSRAVPDHELKGYIYLNRDGKIKHCFVRADV